MNKKKNKNEKKDTAVQIPKELILTRDGRLFLDPEHETEVDRFLAFYQGNLCARDRTDLYCCGNLPEQSFAFSAADGEMRFFPVKDQKKEYLMVSAEPVLKVDASAILLFRYQNMLGLYVADTAFSRAIYYYAVKASHKNVNHCTRVFASMLGRHDMVLGEKAFYWADIHPLRGREE